MKLHVAAFLVLCGETAMAEPSFKCPGDEAFVGEFTELFKAAERLDTANNPDQANAYFSIWTRSFPNHTLYRASFSRDGRDFDLVGVKGSYIGRSGYLDAYTVVFEKGAASPLAMIQTDTNRSDYRCSELAAE